MKSAKSLGKGSPRHRRETGPTHIKDLVPDPANRRAHNPRNLGMVVDALQQVGAARSIVIDEHNVILAGNGVTEAAGEAGITKVRIIDAAGDELIAVRRTGLSEEQKRYLAIADNRTGELATWNFEQLAADKAAGLSLQPFWTPEEEAALLAKQIGAKEGLTDPDAVPQERATDIQPGDLFELGRHRLLCGDSTLHSDVERLLGGQVARAVITSPPYGAQRKYGLGDFDWDAVVPPAIWLASERTAADGHVLVNLGLIHKDGRVIEYWRSLIDAMEGRPLYGWYVWDKLNGQPGDHHGRLAMSHEWIFHFANSPRSARKTMECKLAGQITHKPGRRSGLRGDDDVVSEWTHAGAATQSHKVPDSVVRCQPAKGGVGGHPAPFSVAFASSLMDAYTEPSEIVLDPFGGSGTSLIAATELDRAACMMEIEPAYCQIAIDRWEQFTGQKAVKVGEAVPA